MKRRTFITVCVAGAVGLTLGVVAYEGRSRRRHHPASPASWLSISPDNDITIVVVKNEMGQGIATALPMIVAEELQADWQTIRIELRPELGEYLLPLADALPGTRDSNSVRSRYHQMRLVGAAAREMLVAAAATVWGVEAAELTAHDGAVSHPTKGIITYGELAETAKSLPVPRNPKLKDPGSFSIIGTARKRLDGRLQVEGSCPYGIDTVVPNMAYAAVLLSPVIGGDVVNLSSLSIRGTKAIGLVPVPSGVAVVANSWWDASNTLRSLDVHFTNPPETRDLSSESIRAELASRIQGPAEQVEATGEPHAAMDVARTRLTREFEVPFLDHAALEPLNATAHVTPSSCTVWAPIQCASDVMKVAQDVTRLPAAAITIHPTFLGGGFGRKDWPVDYVTHAILASKAVQRPVKVIWSREQDMTHGAYRSAARAALSAGLDSNGKIVSWIARLAAPRMGYNWLTLSLAGFMKLPYRIPNIDIQWAEFSSPVRNGYWRSVNMSHNTFFVESFMDELAHACAADPLAFRLRHTRHNPRATALLTKVGEMANWGKPGVRGASHGLALFDYTANDDTRTLVAHVAEVTVDKSGMPRVHKVYCAVDCGLAVNPDGIRAQMEGGAIFGLTAALFGEITVKGGAVEQSNFNDYQLLGLRDAPHIETTIINSGEQPAGVGEYGVPGIMPALTNAIFAATRQRIRKLPVSRHALQ